MHLRPIKTAAQEKASHRTYDPVWITAEVPVIMIFSICRENALAFDADACLTAVELTRNSKIIPCSSTGSTASQRVFTDGFEDECEPGVCLNASHCKTAVR